MQSRTLVSKKELGILRHHCFKTPALFQIPEYFHTGGDLRPNTNDTKKRTRNTTKSTHAISEAIICVPNKPSAPAMSAITRKSIDNCNMIVTPFEDPDPLGSQDFLVMVMGKVSVLFKSPGPVTMTIAS